jgi:hypothetical protein
MVKSRSRLRVAGGSAVERLVCHPRLPLVAGLDAERPAVHVCGYEAGRLKVLGTVGAESAAYGDAFGSERMQRTPAVAWHPDQPLLLVAHEDNVAQWTPAGVSTLTGIPRTASYRWLAFSPDGQSLWASPCSAEEGDRWEYSDVVDLASGAVTAGPGWDTGVAAHPAGGLVVTLCSDQAATYGLFAQVERGAGSETMRVLRRALLLDADGYETPIFSPDGRHLAIRGNSYDNSLEVFEFPSLQRVLATTLGEPSPGYPYPQEWVDQRRAWSRHNIAFGVEPGVLWVATPTGTLLEVDLDAQDATEHDVLAGSRLTALAATSAGELVGATGDGELVLLSVLAESASARTTASDAARAAVAAFVAGTSEVPGDGDLEEYLVVTDGAQSWAREDLAAVTTATAADPTWLQMRAAINTLWDSDT